MAGAKTQTIKRLKRLLWLLALAVALVLAFTLASVAAALVDDTFADGNSQNQDLANSSLRLFNGRANTVRTDAVGSVSFDVTNASGSEAFWAYFTNAGAPLRLGLGDKLAVALNFSLAGFGGAGQDVRFGVLDSLGTRNTTNLTAGMNDATFVNDSYIEGDVDFMWGNGAVFFQNCELKAVAPGFYAQVCNPSGSNGNIYVNCRLTGLPTLTGFYLARIDPNVFPYSQVVFINCALGPHILPTGWLLNNATAAPNVQFWEYQSTNLNGAPLDVSQRAPFSRQLSAVEAAQWSNPAIVLGGWTPVALTVSPSLVLMDEALTVNYLAPGGNRATDWVGLFRVGEPDTSAIAQLSTNASINNNLIFKPPAAAGRYEFRYFRGDGARAATSNTVTLLAAPSRRSDAPIGFAAVNALGQNGTTGGAGGQTVTVTTASEFLAALARPEPLIIRVVGMLTLPGPMHDVASHKTIVGVGANSGFSGGGLNIGLPANDNITEPPPNAVKNVIIRNLRFTNLPDDAINIQMFTHHVWIDHCDLSNGFDGLIDVKRGSDYVTISWNRLHQHSKTSLVGHDDNNGAQDSGRLKKRRPVPRWALRSKMISASRNTTRRR